jgi:arylformamidase
MSKIAHSNYLLLSHPLSPALSAYGNGDRIKVEQVTSMEKGDISNNSKIEMNSHFGTHIDLPRHFLVDGKTLSDYMIEEFVFNGIRIIDAQNYKPIDYLIDVDVIDDSNEQREIDLLIFKFGYSKYRDSEKYWRENPGFSPKLVKRIKEIYPNIRAIGFDLISLSSYQSRPLGRIAHKEFLSQDILIIEDMNLTPLDVRRKLNKMIVAPLYVSGAEGAPVTIIGEVK